jgi:hypothetical protein
VSRRSRAVVRGTFVSLRSRSWVGRVIAKGEKSRPRSTRSWERDELQRRHGGWVEVWEDMWEACAAVEMEEGRARGQTGRDWVREDWEGCASSWNGKRAGHSDLSMRQTVPTARWGQGVEVGGKDAAGLVGSGEWRSLVFGCRPLWVSANAPLARHKAGMAWTTISLCRWVSESLDGLLPLPTHSEGSGLVRGRKRLIARPFPF